MKTQKKSYQFLIGVLTAGLLLVGCGQTADKPDQVLQVGNKAADFSLMDATGHPVKLSDIQPGWYSALFFYRGAWCSTCVNQLLDLKEDFSKFSAAHVAVAAISVDTVEDSAAFNNQWRFPFPLLSDAQFHVIDTYGFRDIQGGLQHQDISHIGVVVIDPQKVVRYKYIGKKAEGRPTDDEVLFTIQKLQSGSTTPPTGGAS